jgi:hypothetical protein
MICSDEWHSADFNYIECRLILCHSIECQCVKRHSAECHGAIFKNQQSYTQQIIVVCFIYCFTECHSLHTFLLSVLASVFSQSGVSTSLQSVILQSVSLVCVILTNVTVQNIITLSDALQGVSLLYVMMPLAE